MVETGIFEPMFAMGLWQDGRVESTVLCRKRWNHDEDSRGVRFQALVNTVSEALTRPSNSGVDGRSPSMMILNLYPFLSEKISCSLILLSSYRALKEGRKETEWNLEAVAT